MTESLKQFGYVKCPHLSSWGQDGKKYATALYKLALWHRSINKGCSKLSTQKHKTILGLESISRNLPRVGLTDLSASDKVVPEKVISDSLSSHQMLSVCCFKNQVLDTMGRI